MKTLIYPILFCAFFLSTTGCGTSDNSSNEKENQSQATVNDGYSLLTYEDFTGLEGVFNLYFKDDAGNEIAFQFRPMEDTPIEFLKELFNEDLGPSEKYIGKKLKIKFKELDRENEFTGEMEKVNVIVDIKPE